MSESIGLCPEDGCTMKLVVAAFGTELPEAVIANSSPYILSSIPAGLAQQHFAYQIGCCLSADVNAIAH